ncbi:MAG: DUF559 domain-containing protein, partial [Bacteroidales bacterium]|nr:DUF559 domain-containing protein [Bacteroidales bacterium]
MDKKQAQELIEKTFNKAFSEEQFTLFVKNLLNDLEQGDKVKSYYGKYIWEDYKEHINSYKRIGKYIDPEGEALDVLVVEVKSVNKLERARTTLRNFVIKHLGKFEKDYALVAFYSSEDKGADWRFSFIKLEYSSELDEDKGKVKIEKKFTPAKRYSFLVGEHEKAYTAKNQLLPVLQNIANNPSIEDLETAFSIEKVTDEFFNQYKDLYIKLYEHFENDDKVKAEFLNSGIDNARFTKKLLGQIVFLYFLQKKGWLGVEKNQPWGKGKKHFVQELYKQAKTENLNFFKDKLQYLFYEALAKERTNANSYYERFDCRIPFLNGGLFEADYDWKNAAISLPENLFRNEEKNKAGDIGTGILDVFDRYNFTIKEDEPLDKEVAVDPEMLGKVFENMLDITERKSKGAFYTPREIVHYMCQESLIHYLDNALNTPQSTSPDKGVHLENGGVAKSINNLPHLKTFRKKLRNNLTPAEAKLWTLLKGKQLAGRKFRRQHSVANYILDFYCPSENLAIELDGQGHFEATQAQYDYERDLFLQHCGIKVLRFENKWVWDNLEGLLEEVKSNFGWDHPGSSSHTSLKGGEFIGVNKEDIEIFIREGHFALENDERVVAKGESQTYKYQLPESIRKNADLIDQKLSDIKICDPAIGSGAFPVGLLHELVKAMLVLKPHLTYDYLTKKLKDFGFEHRENINESRYVYRLKRHIIQESIYGVDIDSSAIDIARLRLWLSLVVDEDDLDPIETLPNLDYKIVSGNSLIGLPENAMRDLKVEAELEKLKEKFYNLTNEKEKKEIRQEINTKIRELLDSAEQFAGYKIDFDFKLFFSEVWREKGGFDVVIGNPPYVQLQKNGGTLAKQFEKLAYNTFARTGDIYSLFYEKGWQILKPKGTLTYITSNKWMRAGYGESTRKFFAEHTNPILLIDFAGQKIFDAATVDVNILMFTKDKNQQKTLACIVKEKVLNELSVFVRQEGTKCDFSTKESWIILNPIEQSIKRKIEAVGTPLKDWDINIYRGILTGYNEAFIIDGTTKDKLINEDPKSAEIIRPILRGRDIKRYGYNFADLYLITTFPSLKIDIEKYPAVKAHLLSFGYDRLKQTGDRGARKKTNNKWFETQDSISYWEDFYKQKIAWAS